MNKKSSRAGELHVLGEAIEKVVSCLLPLRWRERGGELVVYAASPGVWLLAGLSLEASAESGLSCRCFFRTQVPPAGNRSQYEEIDIPVALLSYADMLDIGKVSCATHGWLVG